MKSFPCITCKKSVKKNQKALLCTTCNQWIHISCAGVPRKMYDDESEYFLNWQCRKCVLSLLPFYDSEHEIDEVTKKDSPTLINKPPKYYFAGKGFKFAHLNVVSLVKNFEEVKLFLHNNEVDLLALNETRLDDTIFDSEISIPMYHLIRKDRNRHGGGVAIYLKNSLNIQMVEHESLSHLEAICIKLCLKGTKPILFVNWYRPPNSKTHVWDHYENFLEFADSLNLNIIIMGDINYDLLKTQNNVLNDKYLSLNSIYSLHQVNTSEPTRITHESATLLDHIITNNLNNVQSYGVTHVGMSDHSLSYLVWKFSHQNDLPRTIQYRNFRNVVKEDFKNDLRNQPWKEIMSYSDLDEAVHKWHELLLEVVDKHLPTRKKRIRKNTSPWMNSDIFKLMKKRDKAKKMACKNKDKDLMDNYRILRNKVTAEVKKMKKMYYINKLQNTEGNPAQAWKTLKTLLPNKGTSNSVHSSDEKNTANNFNNFFVNVGNELSTTIPNFKDCMTPSEPFCDGKFDLHLVFESDILSMLNNLKNTNSVGLDGISANILKLAAEEITPSLTYLINRTILEHKVPTQWKRAKVVPLFKNGNKELPNNYRPISLLPVVSKILERVVHKQLSHYIQSYNLLASEQSGFRPKHSTVTSLIKVTDDWLNAMDNKLVTGAVFVDLRKAFDTVDHSLLLNKLARYGLTPGSIQWFKDYLDNRQIITQINGTLSEPKSIHCGVPQGSILGPLLFVLYINDLVSHVKKCKVHLYADDTVLYFSSDSIQNVQKTLQDELNSLFKWMCMNKLSLNTEKTVCMLIGSRNVLSKQVPLQLLVNSKEIKQVHEVKYLGVTVDDKLSWNAHTENVCKKVSKIVSFLGRLRYFVNEKNMKLIYNAIVIPQLDYADIVWDAGKKMHAERLQKLQNRAGRIILKINPYLHTSNHQIHDILGWDSLATRRKKHLCEMVYKSLNGTAPSYLQTFFQYKSTDYSLRNESNLLTPKPNLDYCKRMFAYRGALIYNSLSNNTKSAASLNSFKILIRQDLKSF